MTGNIALDVVIGLVFIFLLYSLLASILQEIIANFFGLRARNLKQGLSRMLEDEPGTNSKNILSDIYQDLRQSITRIFSKNESGLLKKFYKQPSIKYLASGNYFSKPSYISEANFSKALIDILKYEGNGDTDLEKIKNALQGTTNDTLLIKNIKDKVGEKITNNEKIEQLNMILNSSSSINEETKKHIQSLLDDAQNDLEKFKANLENWFNDTMERVTGWYKRTNQLCLLIIGLIIAIYFNVNSIEIVKLLTVDKDAREKMVTLASTYISENQELIDLAQKAQKLQTEGSDLNLREYNSQLDSLLKVKSRLEEDIDKVNHIMGYQPIDSLTVTKITKNKGELIRGTLSKKHKILKYYSADTSEKSDNGEYLIEFPSKYLAEQTSSYYKISKSDGEKLYARFAKWEYRWNNILGYIITALSISLGAPFWFDLLNKLIKMRNSIQKKPQPSANSPSVAQVNAPLIKRVG